MKRTNTNVYIATTAPFNNERQKRKKPGGSRREDEGMAHDTRNVGIITPKVHMDVFGGQGIKS